MSILSAVLGGADIVTKVIGAFKLSPEKKAELEAIAAQNSLEVTKLHLELEAKLQDAVTREVEAASANIQAEAASGDKYTARSRPTFLYLIYAVLGWNYLLLPIIQFAMKQPMQPIALPEELMWLFGSGYLGYSGARSWDKWKTRGT